MEEYKLIDIENNVMYFTHIIKSNNYNLEASRQLFESIDKFNISKKNDKIISAEDRIIVIFEISIPQKFVNALVLIHENNPTQIDTASKNKINEYDSLLRRYLMRGKCELSITFNLINPVTNSGTLSIDKSCNDLRGEKSFIRKYRIQVDNIIQGTIPDKNKKEKETTIKFANS